MSLSRGFFSDKNLVFLQLSKVVVIQIYKKAKNTRCLMLFLLQKSVVYWCSKKHKASCEKYKAYILKYKALISKYMPYILGALYFFEIQQYIRLPNRAFFLTYRQLKKLFCRASFLWNSTITVDDEISSLHNPISNNKITCDIRKLSFCKCITYSLWK